MNGMEGASGLAITMSPSGRVGFGEWYLGLAQSKS